MIKVKVLKPVMLEASDDVKLVVKPETGFEKDAVSLWKETVVVLRESEYEALLGNAPVIEKDALRVEVAAVLKHAQALDALISGETCGLTLMEPSGLRNLYGNVEIGALVSTTGGMAVNVGKSLAEALSEKPLHRNAPNRIGADGGSHENLNGGGNNE